MNNQILIGIAALVIAGGGIWAYSSFSGSGNGNGNNNTQSQSEQGNSQLAQSGSFTCEFNETDESTGGLVNATVYVQDGQVRVTSAGTAGEGDMIMKDGTMYTWTQGQGFQMPVGDVESGLSNSLGVEDISSTEDFVGSLQDQVHYNCTQGSVDSSLFELPSDIEFSNLSDLQQQAPPQQ